MAASSVKYTPALESLIPSKWRELALDIGGDPAGYGRAFLQLLITHQESELDRLQTIIAESDDPKRIDREQHNLTETEQKLDYLFHVVEGAERMPLPPLCRPQSWFLPGDEVVYCLDMGYRNNSNFTSTGWQLRAGTIAKEVPEVGCATIEIFKNGVKEPWCDIKWPGLVHEWEADYLKNHQEFLERWLMMADLSVKGFNAAGFRAALERY